MYGDARRQPLFYYYILHVQYITRTNETRTGWLCCSRAGVWCRQYNWAEWKLRLLYGFTSLNVPNYWTLPEDTLYHIISYSYYDYDPRWSVYTPADVIDTPGNIISMIYAFWIYSVLCIIGSSWWYVFVWKKCLC